VSTPLDLETEFAVGGQSHAARLGDLDELDVVRTHGALTRCSIDRVDPLLNPFGVVDPIHTDNQ